MLVCRSYNGKWKEASLIIKPSGKVAIYSLYQDFIKDALVSDMLSYFNFKHVDRFLSTT